MATFKQNNIEFTANKIDFEWPGTSGNSDNGDFNLVDITDISPFVNAVEIDWNGAQIGES